MVPWIIKMLERSTPMLSQNIEAKVDFFFSVAQFLQNPAFQQFSCNPMIPVFHTAACLPVPTYSVAS